MLKKVIVIFIISCLTVSYAFSQTNKNLPNVATLYNPQQTTLHPNFVIFHKNDTISTIYCKLFLNELNFVKLSDRNNEAKVKLKFIFYKSLEQTKIIDSTSKIYTLNYKNTNQSIILSLDINIPKENSELVILSTDRYNFKSNINFITIDKSNISAQNLLLIDASNNSPVFNKFIKPNKTYLIKSKIATDSFLINQYNLDTILPAPPYSNLSNNFKPKLIKTYYVKSNSYFSFSDEAIYKITNLTDSSSVIFSCFDEYFPGIYYSYQMIEPLKYLTTTDEYKKIMKNPNKKLAVDIFWLNKSKDLNVDKLAIKNYYNRVVYSNYKFTDLKEGWKTDRGMIYVIYGPPNLLYVGDNFQEWVYYDKLTGEKLKFIFTKYGKTYTLKREQTFLNSWKLAIKSWNSSKTYVY